VRSNTVAPGRPAVVETDPSSSFACEYPSGINRVLSIPPYLLIDNIGRNIEVWRFRPGELVPAARARYDLTSYPDDPMASLLDVDLHAAFVHGDGRELLTVNHYGRVRGFALPPAPHMRPAWERQLLGDTERIVMAGDRFITSSPRGEFTGDPAEPGIFLFAPFHALPAPGSGDPGRRCDQALADWGVISALAVSAAGSRLAVAAGSRIGMFSLIPVGAGLRLGDCCWEASLSCDCRWLHFDDAERLWAGGSSPAAEGGDLNARGGGVECIAVADGRSLCAAALPDAAAWGYGADPLVLSPGGWTIYALGRDASLHAIDVATGTSRQLHSAPAMRDGVVAPSLGIGHAALRDGWLYAGFSRGGFRLLRYDLRGGAEATRPGVDPRFDER
jgi:hypothetical protein